MQLDEKYCKSTCTNTLWMYDKTNREKKCVTSCPTAAPIQKDGVCITCAEDTQLERPVWNLSAKLCRSCTMADGGLLWDPDADKCASTCPDTFPMADPLNFCRDCSPELDGGLFWNGVECVEKCPLAWDDNNVCKACA